MGGHGVCQTQKQLADDYSHNADDNGVSSQFATPDASKDCDDCVGTPNSGAVYDNGWDSGRSVGCKCDSGFAGPDFRYVNAHQKTTHWGVQEGAKDVYVQDVARVITHLEVVAVSVVTMENVAKVKQYYFNYISLCKSGYAK